MNIICNISEQAEALKYITPYAYAEASNIISESEIDFGLVGIGMAFALAGIVVGYCFVREAFKRVVTLSDCLNKKIRVKYI